MRNAAPWLILVCLAGCTPGATLWPPSQVARDVAAIHAGMEQVRTSADRMAARQEP